MSRFHRFIHTLASSYATIAAAMVYALATVPLALHYLPRKEFGLWAVMAQVVGYITLIELGMTTSVAMHLIDHKDRPNGGVYGSLIQTGALVLAAQGAIIYCVGYALSPLFGHLLAIDANLQQEFIVLLRWQSGLVAFDFATRIFAQIAYAHQRSDLSNYGDVVGYGLNLLALWIAFKGGWGLYSILWSGGTMTLFCFLVRLVICWKCHMLPRRGNWGRPTWAMFKELFHYGRDVFLVTLGLQLVNASQTIIVTRTLGLDTAAVWYVCTKLFLAMGELIWRLHNYAEPMFAEMMTRRETDRLRQRFRDVVAITASISGLAAVLSVVTNAAFVNVWTAGRVSWSPWNDVLLGLWLIVRTVLRCHFGLKVISKKIELLRYVIFGEGLAFVVLALLVARIGGMSAIIGVSIICAISLSGNYVVRQTARYFGSSVTQAAFAPLAGLGRVLMFLGPLGVLTWWSSHLFPAVWRVVWDVGILGILGGLLWLRFGIPSELQTEALRRLPVPYASMLSKLLTLPE